MIRRLRSRMAARVALAGLLVAVGILLYHLTRGTLFWVDEWNWVLHRRGGSFTSLLSPHNQHLSLVPLALYRLLFATFGLHSYAPYRVMVLLAHLGCGMLLFVYAERRVGGWGALAVTTMLLLLGPAWENILWPFQTAWLISLASGIGALLLLDRDDRAGSIGASLLIAVSLASSGIGLPVALGVAAELAVGRRRIGDAWIVGIPLALYALWWIGYQHAGTSLDAVLSAPGFTASEAAAAVASVFGLGGDSGFDAPGTLLTWGAPLLVAVVTALVWRLISLGVVPARVAGLAVIAVSFWVLTAISRSVFGNPYSGRYIYVGALVILLLAVELADGWRPGLRLAALLAVAALAVVVSNLEPLRKGAELLRGFGRVTAADLGAVDIARPVVPPGYVLHKIPLYPLVIVPAASYFAAADADGDPAASPEAIASDPESVRVLADDELIAAERIQLDGAHVAAGCANAETLGAAGVVAPPGGAILRSGSSDADVGVRRFADEYQPLGHLPAHTVMAVRIPSDRSSRPWLVDAGPAGDVTLCPLS